VAGPGDDTWQQPTETLQGGPSRPSLVEKVPPPWWRPAAAVAGFVLGVVAGVGGVLGWQVGLEPPQDAPPVVERPPFRSHEHGVELLLTHAAPAQSGPGGRASGIGPLHVDSVLLLLGRDPINVLRVSGLGRSLRVRARALPVTVSPAARFRWIRLEVVVRDCTRPAGWGPGDRPFFIVWRDEEGLEHSDRVGDFDRSVARSLNRYVRAVCDARSTG